jgi:anti-sigma regulatory factor (Ser/Thr protein kinase)
VPDEITLTIPRGQDFHRVAYLVLGGLAVRMNLTLENLEDLQIALDSILDRGEHPAGDITVRLSLRDGALETRIGPVARSVLDEIEHEQRDELSLRRVLDSTVDDVHVDGEWVTLTKNVAAGGVNARG